MFITQLHGSQNAMSEKVIIKKYSNRRLYDMSLKRYITLEELRDRIQGGIEVQVVDSKTGEDLTQMVLIQLILETQRNEFNGLFSSEVLHKLIQYRDQSMTDFFQKYLPNILNSYMDWQQEAQNHFMHWARLGWSANQYSRDFFMPGFSSMWGMGPDGRNAPQQPSAQHPENWHGADSEIETLKQRINELEHHLKNAHEKG